MRGATPRSQRQAKGGPAAHPPSFPQSALSCWVHAGALPIGEATRCSLVGRHGIALGTSADCRHAGWHGVALLDKRKEPGEHCILAVMTDGLENATREYSKETIKALLDRKQKEEGWLVLYPGAGHDAWTQARAMGLHAGNVAAFDKQAIGVILKRANDGRTAAKAKGTRFGRKPKLTDHQQTEALKRLAAGERLPIDRQHDGRAPRYGREVGGLAGPRACTRVRHCLKKEMKREGTPLPVPSIWAASKASHVHAHTPGGNADVPRANGTCDGNGDGADVARDE